MNTIKKYVFCFAVLAAATVMTSCNNNIDLDAEGIVGAGNYWTTPDDYDKALNSVYGRLNAGSSYIQWLDGVTDDGVVTHSWNRGFQLSRGTANSSEGFASDRWNWGYISVQRANNIISNIDVYAWPGGESNAVRNQYLGEARTLRAYFYLELVSLFGNILFYETNPATLGDADQVPQVEPKVVFDFVIKELGEAIAGLPDSPANSSKIGKPAARLLRARAAAYAAGYLSDDSYWSIVLSETAELMKTAQLADDFNALFKTGNEALPEVILAKTYSEVSKNDFGNWYNNSVGGYCVTTPTKALVDAYEYIGEQVPNMPYINKEPRFYGTILAPGMISHGKYYNTIHNNTVVIDGKTFFKTGQDYGDYYGQDIEVAHGDVLGEGGGGEWNKTPSGLSYMKYYNEAVTWSAWNAIVLLRYAEAYLLRAEALVETGGSADEAKALIKALRDRAGNTNDLETALAGTYKGNLLDMVRNERRIELAQEGLRLFDIRRWKILLDVMNKPVGGVEYRYYPDEAEASAGMTVHYYIQDPHGNNSLNAPYTGPSKVRVPLTDKYYWWPIPLSEMDLDANRTGRIKQNPDW